MKQKDLALIVIVVIISVVFSVGVSKVVFSSPKDRRQKVEVVQPISADFPMPDPQYFNSQSVDPTRLITIGNSANPDPFNAKQ
jgi:hypothetical protein